jgi:hypothetical protein
MRGRCLDPRNKHYADYGGRGIGIHEPWLDLATFLRDVGERPPRHSLDRIDNDGNYEPGNVHWATPAEQAKNRRSPVRNSVVLELQRELEQWKQRALDAEQRLTETKP